MAFDAFDIEFPRDPDAIRYKYRYRTNSAFLVEVATMARDYQFSISFTRSGSAAITGTFTISWPGVATTAAIPMSGLTAQILETAIEAMSAVLVDAHVTGSVRDGFRVEIRNPGDADIGTFSGNGAGLTGGTMSLQNNTPGISPVFNVSHSYSGGTFRLGLNGNFTTPIAARAGTAAIDSALDAVTSFDSADVLGGAGTTGSPWRIRIVTTGFDDIPLLEFDESNLTNPSPNALGAWTVVEAMNNKATVAGLQPGIRYEWQHLSVASGGVDGSYSESTFVTTDATRPDRALATPANFRTTSANSQVFTLAGAAVSSARSHLLRYRRESPNGPTPYYEAYGADGNFDIYGEGLIGETGRLSAEENPDSPRNVAAGDVWSGTLQARGDGSQFNHGAPAIFEHRIPAVGAALTATASESAAAVEKLPTPVVINPGRESNSISVSWAAIPNATGYRVSIKRAEFGDSPTDDDIFTVPANVTSYTFRNLATNNPYLAAPFVNYNVSVTALGGGRFRDSDPGVSTNLRPRRELWMASRILSRPTTTTTVLTWNLPTGVIGDVFISLYQDGMGEGSQHIGPGGVGRVSTYTLTGLSPDTLYHIGITVRRTSTAATWGNSKTAWITTKTLPTQAAPANQLATPFFSSTSIGEWLDYVVFRWTVVANATGYLLEYRPAVRPLGWVGPPRYPPWKVAGIFRPSTLPQSTVVPGTYAGAVRSLPDSTPYEIRITAIGDGVNYLNSRADTIGMATRLIRRAAIGPTTLPTPQLRFSIPTRFTSREPVPLLDLDGRRIDLPEPTPTGDQALQRVAVEFAPTEVGSVYEARYSWDTLRPYTVFSINNERVWRNFSLGPIERRHMGSDGKVFFFIWVDRRDVWWPYRDRQRKTDLEWERQELMVKAQIRQIAADSTEVNSWWSEGLHTRLHYWGVQPDVYWFPDGTPDGGRQRIAD